MEHKKLKSFSAASYLLLQHPLSIMAPDHNVTLTCFALLCREAWILSIPILHMMPTLWPVPQYGLLHHGHPGRINSGFIWGPTWKRDKLLRKSEAIVENSTCTESDHRMRELTGFFVQRPRSTDRDTWKTEDTARWEIPCHDVAWKDLPMGKPKTRMCEVWTLHFFKVPPLTASYSFYICGRMPRGSLSLYDDTLWGMMCDVRWCMMSCFFTLKGGPEN